MKTQSIDTHPETEKIQISILKNESSAKKFSHVRSLSKITIQSAKRGISRTNKNLNEEQVNLLFISYQYGKDIAFKVEKYLEEN